MNFFDFHTHVLFGIDHGIQTYEESKKMLEIYKNEGFDLVVFTPHLSHPTVTTNIKDVRANLEKISQTASEIGIKVTLGSELYLEAQDKIISIPVAGKYSLVEFSPVSKPLDMEGKLGKLFDQGLIPVIAHIERYHWLKPSSDEMDLFLRLGCILSVNVSGIENKSAIPYLKSVPVDLIASDNHGDPTLPGRLKNCLNSYPQVFTKMQFIYENIQ